VFLITRMSLTKVDGLAPDDDQEHESLHGLPRRRKISHGHSRMGCMSANEDEGLAHGSNAAADLPRSDQESRRAAR
jgi:hypothetical protein